MNVAARIEGPAPVGQVAISTETLRRLTGARVEPMGAFEVKGRSDHVEVFRLVSLDAGLG